MTRVAVGGLFLVFFGLFVANSFHIEFKRPNFFAKLFKRIIQPHHSCKCGIPNRNGRFLGGSELTPHEYPWLAFIMRLGALDQQKSQTGTLINDRYILTSATQLFGHTPYLFKVILGYHLLCQSEFTSTMYSVKEIIIHPDFYATTSLNNIAMLKTSVPILFSHHIAPVCLPTPGSTYNGKIGTVASWYTSHSSQSLLTTTQIGSIPMMTTPEMSSTGDGEGDGEIGGEGGGDNGDNGGLEEINLQNGSFNSSTSAVPRSGFQHSCIPRKIGLPIHLDKRCSSITDQNEGCIGIYGVENSPLCQADTGSGVFVQSFKGYVELIGILSNRQWCSGEGSQWRTTSTSPSVVPERLKKARFFELSLLAMPTFAKVDNYLEWILKNTGDALYCHKI